MESRKRFFAFFMVMLLLAVSTGNAFAGTWKQYTKGWQYQNDDGLKSQGKWQFIDGNWYFFHTDGYMAANQ